VRKLRLVKTLATPVLVAALAFAGAMPANAQSVEHAEFSDPFNDTITDLCAFPIQFTGVSSGHVQAFRDDAGLFTKVILHYAVNFTLSANGISLTESDKYNEFDVDFQGAQFPHEVIHTGLLVHIKAPNGSVVVIQSGRIIEDVVNGTVIFEKGNPFTVQDNEALCAALS
jgi:hypothetical protein